MATESPTPALGLWIIHDVALTIIAGFLTAAPVGVRGSDVS